MHPDRFVSTLQEWIIISTRHSMHHFIHHVRESGFSMSHLGAMVHIHQIGSCGVTDLGEHLGVTSAAASQMLERLVQQGLILRSEDPNDRRVKKIVLTDKGQRVLDEGIRVGQRWMDNLAGSLSESEKESIILGLNILIEKLKNLKQPIDSED